MLNSSVTCWSLSDRQGRGPLDACGRRVGVRVCHEFSQHLFTELAEESPDEHDPPVALPWHRVRELGSKLTTPLHPDDYPMLFLVGGSGITPVMAMMRTLDRRARKNSRAMPDVVLGRRDAPGRGPRPDLPGLAGPGDLGVRPRTHAGRHRRALRRAGARAALRRRVVGPRDHAAFEFVRPSRDDEDRSHVPAAPRRGGTA